MQKVKNDIMAAQRNFEANIRTIREKLPESSQIGIGEDFCIVDIKHGSIRQTGAGMDRYLYFT